MEVLKIARWITIGKYHARVNLGKTWIHRKKVFPALIGGFVVYVFILYVLFKRIKTPILNSLGTLPGLEIVVFSVILSLIVLGIWGYIIYINIIVGIRKRKRRDIQLLLSAPITYGDLLIGSFLAMLPSVVIIFTFLYAPIAVAAAVLFGSGLVTILKIGIALGETVILALIVSGIVLAIVEPIVDRVSRNRVALIAFVIIFIVIYSLIYIIPQRGLGLAGVSDNILYRFLPTTLAGNVINEALLGSFGFKSNPSGGMSMFLLGVITLGVFYGGFSASGRLFTLEAGVTTPTVTIEKEGIIYRVLRRFGVGERVIFHQKIFFRNPNNVLQFGMMAAVVYVVPFFTLRTIPEEARAAEVGIIIPLMMILFLAPFPALTVYALSKDAIWLWKSAPDGEKSFLFTKWKQSLISGLVYVPVPIVTGLWMKVPWSAMFIGMLGVFILLAGSTSIGLFVSTYNPAYDVEGMKMALNLIITIGILIGIIAPTGYLLFRLGLEPEPVGTFLLQLLIIIGGLINLIGAVLMILAVRKLAIQE